MPFSYEVSGKGHPLVLVHAGIADQRMWDDQASAFAQYYQVIRYDMRGYGKTAPLEGPFSHYRDLYELLSFLNVEKAYLLGCSLGGATVLDFALTYPAIVDALLLVACAPSGYEADAQAVEADDETIKLQQEHMAAIRRGDIARAAAIEADYWLVGSRRTTDEVDSILRARLHEMNIPVLTDKISATTEEQPLEPVAVKRLHEIHTPTLVITGDLDDPAIVKSGELLASSIVGAKKSTIAGTAHFPNLERPTEFNRLVLEFLASL